MEVSHALQLCLLGPRLLGNSSSTEAQTMNNGRLFRRAAMQLHISSNLVNGRWNTFMWNHNFVLDRNNDVT